MQKRICELCCVDALTVGDCIYDPYLQKVIIPVTLSPVVGCKYNRAEVVLVPADENTEKAHASFNQDFRPVDSDEWEIDFDNVPLGLWQPKARVITDCGACEWILGNTVPVVEADMIKSVRFTIVPGGAGNQAIVGAGFQPTDMILLCGCVAPAAPGNNSTGMGDVATQVAIVENVNPVVGQIGHPFDTGSMNNLPITLVSFDADGCTINKGGPAASGFDCVAIFYKSA